MICYILDENDCPRLAGLTEYYQWKKALPDDIQTGFGFTLACEEAEGVCVSTVYLGADHGYGDGPPVLWETMVFCEGEHDQDFERATSRKDALETHRRFVEKYIGGHKENP
jgi:hypothetical protein